MEQARSGNNATSPLLYVERIPLLHKTFHIASTDFHGMAEKNIFTWRNPSYNELYCFILYNSKLD